MLVVKPQKRGIHSPAADDFQDSFEYQQQSQRAILARREHARVNRKQEETDGKHKNISGSIGEELPGNPPDVVKHLWSRGPPAPLRLLAGPHRPAALAALKCDYIVGNRSMRVCMVSPHLPPEQAAVALLPVMLGDTLASSGLTASYVSHPSKVHAVRERDVTYVSRRGQSRA